MDIPLLAESRSRPAAASEFDYVVTVWADGPLRRERLRDRGLADPDIEARMAAQATDEARQAVSDAVVPNIGTIDALRDRAEALLACIQSLPRRRA